MGEELEVSSPSAQPVPKTPGEWFEYLCPIYMSYGMSYDEFWDGDNEAPKYFRKAYELKRKQVNFDLWLQGAYVYEAILSCAPTLQVFGKSKEPIPYRKSPIPLTAQEVVAEKERAEREKFEQLRSAMRATAERINAQRKARGRDTDAGT